VIELRTLGSLSIRGSDGAELHGLMVQPKRLALLAYLCVATPRGFHRRDALLGLFWPESDEEHARAALRKGLHVLRRAVGETTIVSRGEEDVCVDPQAVWCDAAEFRKHIDEGRLDEAMALYRGDLLPGFFLRDGPAFERWLESERSRFRELASVAAQRLSADLESQGKLDGAIPWARTAVALSLTDERVLRRLLELLERVGDRTGAIAAYDDFVRRVAAETEIEPSTETQQLVGRIRAGAGGSAVHLATPSRLQLPKTGHRDAPRTRTTASLTAIQWTPRRALHRKALLSATAFAVVVAGAGTSWWARETTQLPGDRIESLVVLPFENLSKDPAQEYFADGMHEAIIDQLGRIGALKKVISRTSALRYRKTDKSVEQIAHELGVDAVVEGSVLSADGGVRITVQLIDGATEKRVWGESYERDLRHVLALQAEVARAIAEEIRVTLSPADHARLAGARVVKPEAYQLYLIGNFKLGQQTESAFREALQNFRQATEIDPAYAAAYAGIAMAYIELGSWASSLPPEAVYQQAKAAAMAALERDSTLAEAHIALARVKQLFEWDWSGAEAEFQRGIALNPNATYAWLTYANYLMSMGRFDQVVTITRRVLERDPLSAFAYIHLGWALEHLGRDGEAFEQYRTLLALAPDWHAYLRFAEYHVMRGERDEALRNAVKAESLLGPTGPPAWLAQVAYTYARTNRRADAERILRVMRVRAAREYVPPVVPAFIYVGLGDKEKALDFLEQAYQRRDILLIWLKVRKHLDPLRDEPRFQDLMRRMNFPN
jgi:TolB-like protein/DNA-binding SARP family transcriptional activator/Tfp pilus assembly protein PilF